MTYLEERLFRTNLSTEIVGKYRCHNAALLRLGNPPGEHAVFLRMEKYPLRIKALACRGRACAHFYPQKVCRTLLAAKRATRYIAEFVHV
jgi:hypothetical protein